MISRTAMALAWVVLVAGSASGAPAQEEPPVDSLITHWIERGPGGWTPARLFIGCPDLAEWQQRGIRRVIELDLTIERTNDLGLAWAFPMRECRDPRLEQWYFDRLDEAIARGDWRRMDALRMGLELSDSPRIRGYLRDLMLDTSLPERVRSMGGGLLVEKLTPAETRSEFLSAFEAGRLPVGAWLLADRLLKQGPDRLLREVAPLVRADPALASQTAFSQIVEVGYHLASDEARTELADALEAGLNAVGGGMPEAVRKRVESRLRHLRLPGRGGERVRAS